MSGEFVSTEEAARILGVTVQHVRRLADSGELTRIARGLIDRSSLDRYLTERQGGRTRVWPSTPRGGDRAPERGHPAWLGPVQASRLRSALGEITDLPISSPAPATEPRSTRSPGTRPLSPD